MRQLASCESSQWIAQGQKRSFSSIVSPLLCTALLYPMPFQAPFWQGRVSESPFASPRVELPHRYPPAAPAELFLGLLPLPQNSRPMTEARIGKCVPNREGVGENEEGQFGGEEVSVLSNRERIGPPQSYPNHWSQASSPKRHPEFGPYMRQCSVELGCLFIIH